MYKLTKGLLILVFILFGCIQQVFSQQETGLASWYGPGLHANTTAGGEVFDMNKLTAAHPSLPFDTRVKVTNLSNKKSVVVRINDRGPFVKNRIIDVSREAARKLDIIHSGVVRVKVEVVDNEIVENTPFVFSPYSIPKKSIGAPFGVTRPLHSKVLFASKMKRNFPYVTVENDETD